MSRVVGGLTFLLLVVAMAARPITFWQWTDNHFDPLYTVGTDPKTMCHSGAGSAGTLGDYLCDSSLPLTTSALEYMRYVEPSPAFILWTGDTIPHLYEPKPNLLSILSASTDLVDLAFPNTVVIPLIGNHDFTPQDQLPPQPNWLFDSLAVTWSKWLDASQLATFKAGGYYSKMVLNGHLKVIALNSVFWYNPNNQTISVSDPAGEFAWLTAQLADAEQKGIPVLIAGHVGPGAAENSVAENFQMRKEFNQKYVAIVQRFSKSIIGEIFGHLHSDSFRLFSSHAMFLTPSLTPWENVGGKNPQPPNNPSLRLFQLDDQSFGLSEYIQFYMNLTASVAAGQPLWKEEYRATTTYHISDLSGVSMKSVESSFESSGSATFEKYFLYNLVSYPRAVCDAACKTRHLCAIRFPDADDYASCVK